MHPEYDTSILNDAMIAGFPLGQHPPLMNKQLNVFTNNYKLIL